jgi:hypothetical protein
MKRITWILFLLSISPLFFLSFHQATADDEKVSFAKSLTAKEYDNTLPSIPIEKWLRSTLKKNIAVEWGTDITDCGEQTGNPEIDKERDIPLCADIELKENSKIIGYLLFFIGTENKGVIKEKTCLYYGYINSNDRRITFKRLSELENIR